VVRTTLDTDIVADLHLAQVPPFTQLLASRFYLDAESIRHAVRVRSSFNLIHLPTMFKVDVFVIKDRPFDRQQLARRRPWTADPDSGRVLYVASPEDILLAKMEWYRLGGDVSDRQWRDIIGVLSVQGDRLDRDYLRRWAGALGVLDLPERALAGPSAADSA
jgi:hypothetical protein